MAPGAHALHLVGLAAAAGLAAGGCQQIGTSLHLTEDNFADEVLKSDALVTFVEFSSPWCIWAIPDQNGHGDCAAMRQSWDELEEKWGNHTQVHIGEVDCSRFVMNGTTLCRTYDIKSYPTLYYFSAKTGVKGEQYTGGHSFEEMDQFLIDHAANLCSVSQDLALEPSEACSAEEAAFLTTWRAKSAAEVEAELERLEKVSAAHEVTFGEKVREWMAKRINVLKQLRSSRTPRPPTKRHQQEKVEL